MPRQQLIWKPNRLRSVVTDARMSPGRRTVRSALLGALLNLCAFAAPPAIHAAQLTLTWVDTSSGQAAVAIERAIGDHGTYTNIGKSGPGETSYVDSTVAFGTTYCYRVQAVVSDSVSPYSNIACAAPAGGFTVSVVKTGTGTGTVVSAPPGISCGTACSAGYFSGNPVTLTATPSAGAIFTGWSGGCSGSGACTLAGNGSVTVNADFAAVQPHVTSVRITADKLSPQPPGSTIMFTAIASGCVAPYEYLWFVFDGSSWTLAQNWSTSNSLTWRPSVPIASGLVTVSARCAGSGYMVSAGLPYSIK